MREALLARLRTLSAGLEPDGACVDRLFERLAAAEDGPEIKALILERGALAILQDLRHEAAA